MIDVYDYDGKKVRVVCIEDEVFEGVASVDMDFESQRDYIDFEQDGAIYEIYADEIKSIEIIE